MSRLPAAEATTSLTVHGELDLRRTVEPLAHGYGDPTVRIGPVEVWLGLQTPAGPATLHIAAKRARVAADAWGPGATAALDMVPDLVGTQDDPLSLLPRHPLLRQLQRRFAGVRLTASRRPFDALLPAILEQKVTGIEARAAYRALVRRHGDLVPGPLRLWRTPAPDRLAALPYYAFHPFGIERRRAELIRRAGTIARRLGATTAPAEASTLLTRIPGIGPWTAAEVVRVAFADPDALSIGDYHLPSLVSWALAGEPRADDARMLELLEPYRGQRARVQRLLELSGIRPPRYGPRMAPRQIAGL
jgi:3-methyladenine DNA glycosylase/8-oxoguanine DNA glycosylase